MVEKLLRYASFLDKKGSFYEADRFEKAAFKNGDDWSITVLEETPIKSDHFPAYIIRKEHIRSLNPDLRDSPGGMLEMMNAYTEDGNWIGGLDDAKTIVEEMGIRPELKNQDCSVCSIGFSDKLNKFFGWSHRAIKGFGVGDECYEEYQDREAAPDPDEAWSISQNRSQRMRKIKSIEEAKESAIKFSDSVS